MAEITIKGKIINFPFDTKISKVMSEIDSINFQCRQVQRCKCLIGSEKGTLSIRMHAEHMHLMHHLIPNIRFCRLLKAYGIMIKDPIYQLRNDSVGGTFLFARGRTSLWRKVFINYFTSANKMKVNNEIG